MRCLPQYAAYGCHAHELLCLMSVGFMSRALCFQCVYMLVICLVMCGHVCTIRGQNKHIETSLLFSRFHRCSSSLSVTRYKKTCLNFGRNLFQIKVIKFKKQRIWNHKEFTIFRKSRSHLDHWHDLKTKQNKLREPFIIYFGNHQEQKNRKSEIDQENSYTCWKR